MNKVQVAKVLSMLDEKKLNGQFITLTTMTQSGFSATAKKAGYMKLAYFQSHNWVKSFQELVNTSTGLVDAGIVYPEPDASKYSKIDVNGLFVHLNSDIEKWYIRCMFNEHSSKPFSMFIDSNGNKVMPEECLTPSALKEYNGTAEHNTDKGQLTDLAKVVFRNFSIDNIMRLSIGGETLIDSDCVNLIDVIDKAR